MIQIEFSQEAIDALNYERYHHPHPMIQKRMDVLYLKSQGLKHQEISRICRISKMTLTTYLKQYLDGGMDKLKQLGYKGQPSALNEHGKSLEKYFKEHPPRNTAEAQAVIEKITSIRRSPTQVRAFMKRIGMK